MCGHFPIYGPVKVRCSMKVEIDELDPLMARANRMPPRSNFAPAHVASNLRVHEGSAQVDEIRVGVTLNWAKDANVGNKAINAPVETVYAKSMFRGAFKARRCVVSAQGYFQWKGGKPPKQPYLIRARDETLLLFAGL